MREKRTFESIIENLKPTIANYDYYVNFSKIYQNLKNHEDELNLLNSLIGSQAIEEDFINLVHRYPQVLEVVPWLLAIRNSKIEVFDQYLKEYNFKEINHDINEYLLFMRKVGLFELLETQKIKNLNDYVFGIEVGMDTNARKNRSGKIMEDLVESYIKASRPLEYFSQMPKKAISQKYGIDIDLLLFEKNNPKEAEKRFDFVVQTENDLYLIEVNFYQGGGSKLNETARSFKALSHSVGQLERIHFVWITDGVGWKSAKNNLKEAYEDMVHLYTLYDLEQGLLPELFETVEFEKIKIKK